jgi:uncharacterized FAD-dependent dehydrogenase
MSTAENKLNLVQIIVESEDKTFISKVLEYARTLKKQKTGDTEDGIPDYVLEEVRLAMEELDNGRDEGTSHEDMLKQFKKEFPSLKI